MKTGDRIADRASLTSIQGGKATRDFTSRKGMTGISNRGATSVTLTRNAVQWMEPGLCFLAMAGVLVSVLLGFHPREWQASGSDLKTLYASAQCFREHIDAYTFTNIESVFRSNHVVPPDSWYAHAPVYPPFTLAIVAPLTLIPMVPAVYLWITLSTFALALAMFSLIRAADVNFHTPFGWRMLLIGLAAASPLASFSLEMCNVSVLVAALCIFAVAQPGEDRLFNFARPAALCAGLLLKPHLAIWIVFALVVSKSPKDRALARWTAFLFAASCLAIGAWMATQHQLASQLSAYRSIVASELNDGSMAASNHEIIAVAAQITSLGSLLGYWIHSFPLTLLTDAGLALLATGLIAAVWRIDRADHGGRLLGIAGFAAFGMLATYHRAHDGTVLLLLLPYVVWRLQQSWHDWFAWGFIFVSFVCGLGPSLETLDRISDGLGFERLANLLAYRQAPVSFLLLFVLVIAEAFRSRPQATAQVVAHQEYESKLQMAS